MAEDYRDGHLPESEFLRRLLIFTGHEDQAMALAESLGYRKGERPAAAALMERPINQQAPALQSGITVQPDDPAIKAEMIEFPGDDATLLGYLALPRGDGPYPGVLVIHENRGLWPPHYADVARRFAKEGYVALAIDLLSREGGTSKFSDPSEVTATQSQIPRERFVQDMNAGVRHLQSLPYVQRDRIGATGYCFGGGMVWLLTVRNQDIRAAAPYYGVAPPLEEVPNIRAVILGIYAENDARINATVPDLEEALKKYNKTYRFVTYPAAEHAFFNDTGQRYHPQAATEAWRETLDWFGRYLKN